MICSTSTASARMLKSDMSHLQAPAAWSLRIPSFGRAVRRAAVPSAVAPVDGLVASDSERPVDDHGDCQGPEGHAGEQWSVVQQQLRGTSAALTVAPQ